MNVWIKSENPRWPPHNYECRKPKTNVEKHELTKTCIQFEAIHSGNQVTMNNFHFSFKNHKNILRTVEVCFKKSSNNCDLIITRL